MINTHFASPTKSSFETESLSMSLMVSSETWSVRVNTKVSFHSGSLPAPKTINPKHLTSKKERLHIILHSFIKHLIL